MLGWGESAKLPLAVLVPAAVRAALTGAGLKLEALPVAAKLPPGAGGPLHSATSAFHTPPCYFQVWKALHALVHHHCMLLPCL